MPIPVIIPKSQDHLMAMEPVRLNPSRIVCPACGDGSSVDFMKAPDRFHGRDYFFDLRRCQSCSLVWISNPPLPEEMGSHYGMDYHRAITTGAETFPERWELHRKRVSQFKQSGSVLDIGCSSGSFLNALKTSNWRLHGIEMSPDEAQRARSRTGAEVFVGEIQDASFPENSFDLITCFDVLEHVYNPKECLEKVQYWLKPGGVFFVFIPNIEAWEARFFSSYWYGLEIPRHLFHFSPESLRQLTTRVGLQEVSQTTPPASYAENSIRYVCDDALRRVGYRRAPLSAGNDVTFSWKVVRKLFRLTALSVLRNVSSVARRGPAIEGVFRKP
jgi:SAM-dependent methyltransferase